eukprot:scaffold1605_cov158-Amphora_coffeaeformis.AAC.12
MMMDVVATSSANNHQQEYCKGSPMQQPLNTDMAQLLEGLSCEDLPNRTASTGKRNTILHRRRSVKFPETDEQLHLYHEGPDVDILAANRRDIWYQYEELKHIKRKALVLSKEAQRYGLGSILTNTYGKASTENAEALHTWVRNASSRRGLERWINDEYAAKRGDIRKRTIQSVLRAQHKMQESAIQDPDYSMKVLSRLSEAFSVDSKEFARGMGQADEVACKEAAAAADSDMAEEDNNGIPPIQSKSKKMDPMVLRKAPLRLNSPRTVIPGRPPAQSLRGSAGRSLGLSKESATADFRHFY